MTGTLADPHSFKFQWLDDQGQPSGLHKSQGTFDGSVLKLDKIDVPANVIAHVEVRDRRMWIVALNNQGQQVPLGIQPHPKREARKLKLLIDVARSAAWAKQEQDELSKNGEGHLYRDEQCPHCTAIVVLSRMPESPQVVCPFCLAIGTLDATERPAGEQDIQTCPRCEMYSRPRQFEVGYILFLLVAVVHKSQQEWCCPICIRRDVWKMLFTNLPTLIGSPAAFYQMWRAYVSSPIRGTFAGLDAGNLYARKGNWTAALENYRRILERAPHAAGIHYNIGLALAEQNETDRAIDAFELALKECSNYGPAYRHLRALYEQTGDHVRLRELKEAWEPETESARA
ncbi:MAG: tetratricopeptide repeat protein [Maioricimonas sp. JB049]